MGGRKEIKESKKENQKEKEKGRRKREKEENQISVMQWLNPDRLRMELRYKK